MVASRSWTAKALALLGLVVAATAADPADLRAQTFDFPVIPRGTFSFETESHFFKAEERFRPSGAGLEGSVPFGDAWSAEGMGVDQLPGAEPVQARVRELMDQPDYRLDLGISGVRMELEEIRFPLTLAYGATSWLTVEATMPIYRQRVDATHGYSPEGANVGPNPAVVGDEDAVQGFLDALADDAQAADEWAEGVCEEADEDAPECQDALDLAADAEGLRDELDDLFDAGPVLPLEGSQGGEAVDQRFVSLREALDGAGLDPQASNVPLPEEPLSGDEFRGLVMEPAFGTDGPPLDTFTDVWQVGDVEAAVSALFLDVGVDPADLEELEEARFPLRFRSGGTVRYRFPTAEPDTMRNYVEMERHRGHPQLELRSLNDLSWPGRAGLRADLRYAWAGSAEVPRRIHPVDAPLDPEAPVAVLDWTPGNTFELDLDARVELTSELALSAGYAFLTRGSESFAATGENGDVDPSPLELDSDIRLHRAGFQLAFSTVDAWRGERTRLPFEVRGGWTRGISGTGERAPRGRHIHLALRVFIPR